MTVKNTHPEYDRVLPEMILVRDFYDGERAVKEKTTTYLTPTVAQKIDGMTKGSAGLASYEKYLEGARCPDLVKQAIETMLGLMHKEDAVITVPPKMEPLLGAITQQGGSIQSLIRRINEQQLISGRCGLLLDADENKDAPYISLYHGESIRNWGEITSKDGLVSQLKMVVLDEPFESVDDFKWMKKESYRVLSLFRDGELPPIYKTGVFEDIYDESAMHPVMLIGNTLQDIPFVFINTKTHLSTPDLPPLLGLAYRVLGIYRSEANYRYHLYMQSQDTLVRVGHMGDKTEPVRIGAGAVLDVNIGGDAKFIGVNSGGLSEERLAIERDYDRAESMAMKFLEKKAAESNDALITRKNSQTSSMTQIAKTSAEAVEIILKKMALWMGLNPDDVRVTAYTDFGDSLITASDVISLETAKTMGALISQETIHERMRESGLTDKTLEEERIAIANEDAV